MKVLWPRMKPPLYKIPLEDVAAYLKCHPDRLRKLLSWLAKNPSMIGYGPDHYQNVVITKTEPLTDAELEDYMQDSGNEIIELEDLYDLQDDRQTIK